jgi:3-carboxy-cis,cis-muconate cycloisomerase
MTVRLLESVVTTAALADAFSDASVIGGMLRFELALARAEASAGVVPAWVADAVAAVPIEAFDAAAIAGAARQSGTIAIPFVSALVARVQRAAPAAAPFVHWGATSQDVTDTALVLCLQTASSVIAQDHQRLAASLRTLSERHRDTVMLARTLLQPAAPITFGLKTARWFAAVSRAHDRVAAAFHEAAVLQFGGPSGTLASLGANGPAVAEHLARELGLTCPAAPWHTDRTRLGALIAALAVYTGALGKIARDVSLLMQFEVGEAAEPGGGSSSMPHKRNPSGCAAVLAAATRVPALASAFLTGMVQEHERGLGGWHAEALTVAEVVQSSGSAVLAAADLVEQLEVDADRMRSNIAATRGVIFAERATSLLAPTLGREAAARIVTRAIEGTSRGDATFAAALRADPDGAPVLGQIAAALDQPEDYLGAAETFRRRLLGDEKG